MVTIFTAGIVSESLQLSNIIPDNMRTLSSFFHAAPSDEFTVRPLVGLQHVWKRIFEHLMDRGDTYKRTAFNNLHDKNKNLEEDTYADLRVLHDAYVIGRPGRSSCLD